MRDAAAQFGPFDGPAFFPAVPAVPLPAVQDSEANATEEDTVVIDPNREPVDMHPRHIRFTMLDGSIFAGQLNRESITVQTEFGDLVVPIHRIKRLRPGLRSYPQLAEQLNSLIEQLGAEAFEEREQARKELLEYQLQIRNVVNDAIAEEEASAQPNVERVRQLQEIRKHLDSLADDRTLLEDGDTVEPWTRWDTIATDSFVIVGSVQDQEFSMDSKYGPLTVNLQDVREADRMFGQTQVVSRAINVSGENLVQRQFKSAGIRIEAGDRITIQADGQITMTPWGSNQMATPDGNAYYGMYNQFPGGALIARIGDSGNQILVGGQNSFHATSSGVLQFAIAMQDQYANSGYQYPGQYRVRIKVEPK